MKKTVLVVDDHEGFRTSARKLLEAEGFEVVGEAADATSGMNAVAELHPDVVLLDVYLPDIDGVQACKWMSTLNGGSVIILISSHDVSDLGGALSECPAIGFIPKSELSGQALSELLNR